MTSRIAFFNLLAAVACGETSSLTTSLDRSLTLTASDAPATAGLHLIAPTAEGAQGAVTAHAVRYGSLCATAVAGHAEIVENRITLHIVYSPRVDTICLAEARALRYDAVIEGLAPGRYEVHIRHSEGAGTGEAEMNVQDVNVSAPVIVLH